jgi:hypothetical protein
VAGGPLQLQQPQPLPLPQENPAAKVEEDADDEGEDGAGFAGKDLSRKGWSEVGERLKREFMARVLPELVNVLQARVHSNSHGDIPAMLAHASRYTTSGLKQNTDRAIAAKNLADSHLIQELVQSYIGASPKSQERLGILSIFSREFTFAELNDWVFKEQGGIVISYYVKQRADEHADSYGPGRDGAKPEPNIRNTVDEQAMALGYEFLAPYVNSHAYGTREVPLGAKGQWVELPKATCDKSPAELMALYKNMTEDKGHQELVLTDAQVFSSYCAQHNLMYEVLIFKTYYPTADGVDDSHTICGDGETPGCAGQRI